MMIPGKWVRAFAAPTLIALLCVAATRAQAAPIRYEFFTGTANISLTTGTTTLLVNAPLYLDGIFATFDAVTADLVDFHFTTAPGQSFTLSQAFGGYDDIVVESASMAPGAGYATLFGTQNPDGTYSVTVAPITTSGIYSASNTAGPPPPPVSNTPISFTNSTPLVANIDLINQAFLLQGLTLAEIWVPGESAPAVLKADLFFKGIAFEPVPEPGIGVLALLALAALAVRQGAR